MSLVVKAWCSFKVVSGRRDTRLDSASSLCEDLCRNRAKDLTDRFSVEAVVQDPCAGLSVQSVI